MWRHWYTCTMAWHCSELCASHTVVFTARLLAKRGLTEISVFSLHSLTYSVQFLVSLTNSFFCFLPAVRWHCKVRYNELKKALWSPNVAQSIEAPVQPKLDLMHFESTNNDSGEWPASWTGAAVKNNWCSGTVKAWKLKMYFKMHDCIGRNPVMWL